MENAELITYILRDEDNIRKVKEWIMSREEMEQASVAAASYSAMPLEEFLASLPSAEFSKMIQDLNLKLFEGPSSPDTSMAQGCPSDLRGDLASPDHVPAELEQNDDITDEVQNPKMNQDQEINMDGEEEAYLMFKQNMMQRKACQQIAPGDNEQSSIENKERNMPNVGFDVSVGAGWPLSGILQHSSESKQDRRKMKETIAVERNIPSNTFEHDNDQSGVGLYNYKTASVGIQQYSNDHEPVLSTPVGVMEEERNVSHDAEHVDVSAQGGARFIPGRSHWHTHSSVDTSPQSPNLQLQQGLHVQLPLGEIVNSLSRTLENILSTRSDQSTSDSLKAEMKRLKKSIILMGQQIEKLKEQNVIQDEIIKGYEETINNKNQQLAENFSVIQYFHKVMTERKNKIDKLEKELEILEDKHEEKNRELKKVAEREEEECSQLVEKIKMRTEMIQNLYEEHLVLKEGLRQKCDEFSELQKEIALLKEASLKEKLEEEKAKKMIQNLYQENQVLKEALRQKCDESNDLHKEFKIASLKEEIKLLQEKLDILKAEKLEEEKAKREENKSLQEKLDILKAEKLVEEKAKKVLQEKYALESQLIEGINNETQRLVQVYINELKAFVQKNWLALRTYSNYSERKGQR